MNNSVIAGLLIVTLSTAPALAVGSNKAEYMGGTVSLIPDRTEGHMSVKDATHLVFEYKRSRWTIPYSSINGLEYGQKAGRRVGVAIAISPIALLSKKRKHYLTVNYLDEQNVQHAAVFELGKDIIRVTLSTLEARTGQRIEYQDDDARRASRGN